MAFALDDADALSALLRGDSGCSDLLAFADEDASDEVHTDDCAAAAPAAAAADWRCLESGHGAVCERCTEPPPASEAARYELVGEPGKKNGEKRLRATLTRTPEWSSLASREKAAAALRTQSPRLAAALLARRSAAMTKADLLLLCAHWRLRSDRWRRRGDRPPRPPPQPAGQLVVVERPIFPPALRLDAPEELHPSAVWAHIGAHLRPLSLRSGHLLAGPAAAALAARDAAAARLYRRELATMQALELQWAGRQAAMPGLQLNVHAAEAQLPSSAAMVPASSYAWPPAVQAVPVLAQIGTAHFCELRAFGSQRMAEPGNGAAEVTWLEEMLSVHATTAELFTQIGAVLGASLRASAATHVTVASMLLDLMMTHISADFHAFIQRRRWMEALPADGDDGGFDARRKPLMPPMSTPTLECLPSGCFGAITVS